jgi:hypothetical protein
MENVRELESFEEVNGFLGTKIWTENQEVDVLPYSQYPNTGKCIGMSMTFWVVRILKCSRLLSLRFESGVCSYSCGGGRVQIKHTLTMSGCSSNGKGREGSLESDIR